MRKRLFAFFLLLNSFAGAARAVESFSGRCYEADGTFSQRYDLIKPGDGLVSYWIIPIRSDPLRIDAYKTLDNLMRGYTKRNKPSFTCDVATKICQATGSGVRFRMLKEIWRHPGLSSLPDDYTVTMPDRNGNLRSVSLYKSFGTWNVVRKTWNNCKNRWMSEYILYRIKPEDRNKHLPYLLFQQLFLRITGEFEMREPDPVF